MHHIMTRVVLRKIAQLTPCLIIILLLRYLVACSSAESVGFGERCVVGVPKSAKLIQQSEMSSYEPKAIHTSENIWNANVARGFGEKSKFASTDQNKFSKHRGAFSFPFPNKSNQFGKNKWEKSGTTFVNFAYKENGVNERNLMGGSLAKRFERNHKPTDFGKANGFMQDNLPSSMMSDNDKRFPPKEESTVSLEKSMIISTLSLKEGSSTNANDSENYYSQSFLSSTSNSSLAENLDNETNIEEIGNENKTFETDLASTFHPEPSITVTTITDPSPNLTLTELITSVTSKLIASPFSTTIEMETATTYAESVSSQSSTIPPIPTFGLTQEEITTSSSASTTEVNPMKEITTSITSNSPASLLPSTAITHQPQVSSSPASYTSKEALEGSTESDKIDATTIFTSTIIITTSSAAYNPGGLDESRPTTTPTSEFSSGTEETRPTEASIVTTSNSDLITGTNQLNLRTSTSTDAAPSTENDPVESTTAASLTNPQTVSGEEATTFPANTITTNTPLVVTWITSSQPPNSETEATNPPEEEQICNKDGWLECDGSSLKCKCQEGMTYWTEKNECVSIHGRECQIGESGRKKLCTKNAECSNIIGQMGVCKCKDGFLPDGEDCLPALHSPCNLSTNLRENITSSDCYHGMECRAEKSESTNLTCGCKEGWIEGKPGSYRCFLNYNSTCKPEEANLCNEYTFLNCSTASRECKCADPTSQLYDEEEKVCVGIASAKCKVKEDSERASLKCVKNSECKANSCECISGYENDWKGNCHKKSGGNASFYYSSNFYFVILILVLLYAGN